MNSYKGWQEKDVFALIIATCQQLLKLHFSTPKCWIFNPNWDGIDCGLRSKVLAI